MLSIILTMVDLLLLLFLVAVLNWAVVDIYFYSIIFAPIREYGAGWEKSTGGLRQMFRYLLDCPFCLSHWTAAASLAVITGIGHVGWLPVTLHPLAAVVFIPVVARVSLVMRDYSLPPLLNYETPSTETIIENTDRNQESIPDVPAATDPSHYPD